MLVVGVFGVLGVLIAAIGLYGVMAHLATQRTHEIGIRMALGATRLRVMGMVLSHAALLALAGLVIGAAGVWYFAHLVEAFLFDLEPLNAGVATAAVAVMALAAFLAAAIPARRAASVDPLVALRQD
jgi:putative ABC transport system permease protein